MAGNSQIAAGDVVRKPTEIEIELRKRAQITDAIAHLNRVRASLQEYGGLTLDAQRRLDLERERLCDRLISLERTVSGLPSETTEDVVRKAFLILELLEDEEDYLLGRTVARLCWDVVYHFSAPSMKAKAG